MVVDNCFDNRLLNKGDDSLVIVLFMVGVLLKNYMDLN